MGLRTTSRLGRVALVGCAVASMLVGAAPARAAGDVSRYAHRALAAATPLSALPGQNDTALGGRLYGTRTSVENPPALGHALAAVLDLGFVENQFGPVGPRAETDSSAENLPRDETTTAGPSHLEAHSGPRHAESVAVGGPVPGASPQVTGDEMESFSWSDADGDGVVARARARIGSVTAGLFAAESVVTEVSAEVHVDAPARGTGVVVVAGATFGGVPVIVEPEGLAVDTTRVPLDEQDQARRDLTDLLSSSEFFELRLVQPVIAPDSTGTGVRVRGGGLIMRMASGELNGNYFFETILASAEVTASIGADLGDPAPDPVVPVGQQPSPTSDVFGGGVDRGGVGGAAPLTAAPVASSASPAPLPPLATAQAVALPTRTIALPSTWAGLPWLILALGLAALAGAALAVTPLGVPVRRQAGRVAEQYLRG